MKKTQVKDATRNIKKNLLSWISVVFIAAMAASSYLGICYSAASMRNAGDSFYQRTSYRDFEVTSSLLLTGADIDALAADEDVRDVEGIYFANAKVSNGDVHENVNVVSVSERINVPELVEGSLPQKADEILVGSAQRIRTDLPKAAFLLGANEGMFPKGYTDGGKVSPRTMRTTAIGGMLGLLLAAAFVVITYLMNDTIATPEDVQMKLGMEVLASLPLDDASSRRSGKSKKRGKGILPKRRKR